MEALDPNGGVWSALVQVAYHFGLPANEREFFDPEVFFPYAFVDERVGTVKCFQPNPGFELRPGTSITIEPPDTDPFRVFPPRAGRDAPTPCPGCGGKLTNDLLGWECEACDLIFAEWYLNARKKDPTNLRPSFGDEYRTPADDL